MKKSLWVLPLAVTNEFIPSVLDMCECTWDCRLLKITNRRREKNKAGCGAGAQESASVTFYLLFTGQDAGNDLDSPPGRQD